MDLTTGEKQQLLTTKYRIKNINIIGYRLFYRTSGYGKILEMPDDANNLTVLIEDA